MLVLELFKFTFKTLHAGGTTRFNCLTLFWVDRICKLDFSLKIAKMQNKNI